MTFYAPRPEADSRDGGPACSQCGGPLQYATYEGRRLLRCVWTTASSRPAEDGTWECKAARPNHVEDDRISQRLASYARQMSDLT